MHQNPTHMLLPVLKVTPSQLDFLRALEACGVRYVVVGGQAVLHYVPSREPKDLDVLIDPEKENLVAAFDAMGRVDPRYFRKKPDGAPNRRAQAIVDLGQDHADVLTEIEGMAFADVWRDRSLVEVAEIKVAVLSLDHLILSKSSAERSQDATDVPQLIAAARSRRAE